MKSPTVDSWIAAFLAEDPPRSKSVVMTVFGDSITPRGGSVWLGSLMSLLQPFGISDRLVRTSVFRLAEEGWLDAERSGRRSLYRMTGPGQKRFERAHRRIYFPVDQPWDGRWTLVMTAPEAIGAGQRAALKKELLWEGFGSTAPGVYVHPRAQPDALQEILERTGTAGRVLVCLASAEENVDSRPLADLVDHCWQLDRVIDGYQRFVRSFEPLHKLLAAKPRLDPEHAFVIRTLLIHAFRRVQLNDPQLPLALLPADWPGTTAYELCRRIYQLCYRQAEQYVDAALAAEGEDIASVTPDFFARFGGLA